jgi:hypothetical protein
MTEKRGGRHGKKSTPRSYRNSRPPSRGENKSRRMEMKKFPTELFVKVDGNTGEEYFVACESMEEAAELGSVISVGVYRLESTAKIKALVHLETMAIVKVGKQSTPRG